MCIKMSFRSSNLELFTDVFGDEIENSQPISLSLEDACSKSEVGNESKNEKRHRPAKGTGQHGHFRSIQEIDPKYRSVFSYQYFNIVQSKVIEDALYSDKSLVICAPTGSGKTVVFEMAIVQLLMEMEDQKRDDDFKIIYMAPVKALCTERLTEWYPKFTHLGLLCIEVTGDTDVDFSQLKPYKIIITTPEKWDMLTRRWRDHRSLVEMTKLFLIDEVHILNDETRGPVLEAVVSRMKTVESSAQAAHRIEALQKQYKDNNMNKEVVSVANPPRIRFVAVSATVGNPEDVADWLGSSDKPAVFHRFGDECRPVKLRRVVEGYPCAEGTSIFKFDIILNYKLWPIIQKYYNGKPTLIFCNTRKSVTLTAETLSKELTITFNPEQKAKLITLASSIKTKKLQALVMSGVGCHHAGMLFEERNQIEQAFRNRDLPILITTTTLAMGVNLPAHLVIIKNTQQYVNGAYQEYSISTVLQMVGRAGRPQFDTEATAVIMTRLCDKHRYQALVAGNEPLQSYLHMRLSENLNSEAALGTVGDVAQCVQWLRSTFLNIRAAKDPKRYLGLPMSAPPQQISKKIEELCVKAMNRLAGAGLISMDEACCIQSTEAGRLMSHYYLDLETMKNIMKIEGDESLERMLCLVCDSHELSDLHLRVDERRCLNALNRNSAAATIRYPMKGKISTRQMKLNCVIQAILGCLPIPDPSLNQEATKVMRIAERICKCLVSYLTRSDLVTVQPKHFSAVLNAIILAKCVRAHLWENSPYVSRQLKGIGPTFSTLLATAGKVNFLLLEESHPRDLERIMNKSAPAGNILRKQVSLLPKYQITLTPVDEAVVSVKLLLLNQSYLSENIDNLTAGENHMCYVIAGDSENNLLLLSTFRDKDLMSLYDGVMTFEIKRRLNTEHKVIVQCISSNFVGIDVQSEYIFNSIEPLYNHIALNSNYTTDDIKTSSTKQTCITDTFKERKRRNNINEEISQSKQKKKRENEMIAKLKVLKESFGKASEELKKDLERSQEMSTRIFCDLSNKSIYSHDDKIDLTHETVPKYSIVEIHEPMTKETIHINEDEDDLLDDVAFDNLLNGIENEISKNKTNTTYLPDNQEKIAGLKVTQNFQRPKNTIKNNTYCDSYLNVRKKDKRLNKKSNYSFLDTLETENKTDDEKEMPKTANNFSDSIKSHIEYYLQNAKVIANRPELPIKDLLLDNNDILVTNDNFNQNLDRNAINVVESNKIKGTNALDNNSDHDITKQDDHVIDICVDKQKEELLNNELDNELIKFKLNTANESCETHNMKNVKDVDTKQDDIVEGVCDTNNVEVQSIKELNSDGILNETGRKLQIKQKLNDIPKKDTNTIDRSWYINKSDHDITKQDDLIMHICNEKNVDKQKKELSNNEIDSEIIKIKLNTANESCETHNYTKNLKAVETKQDETVKGVCDTNNSEIQSVKQLDSDEIFNETERKLKIKQKYMHDIPTLVSNKNELSCLSSEQANLTFDSMDTFKQYSIRNESVKRSNTDMDMLQLMYKTEEEIQNLNKTDQHNDYYVDYDAISIPESLNAENANSLIPCQPPPLISQRNELITSPKTLETLSKVQNLNASFKSFIETPTPYTQLGNNKLFMGKQNCKPTDSNSLAHLHSAKLLQTSVADLNPIKSYVNYNKSKCLEASTCRRDLNTQDIICNDPIGNEGFADYNSFYDTNEASSQSIRNFSYKTEKTNVSTKYMPNYQLQIIRKLKVNLDITEIVTCEKNNTCTTNAENQNKAVIENNVNLQNEFKDKISNNDLNKTSIILKNSNNKNNHSIHNAEDKIHKIDDAENNILKEIDSTAKQNNVKIQNQNPVGLRADNEKPSQSVKENYEFSHQKYSTTLSEKAKDSKKKTVEDIFEAYNKSVQRKNAIAQDATKSKVINPILSEVSRPNSNRKRPFRICDIDKVDATIPSFIIGDKPKLSYASPIESRSLPNVNKYNNTFNKERNISRLECNMEQDVCNEDLFKNIIEEGSTNIQEENDDNEFDWLEEPCTSATEPMNLDTSMFDPRALLQHFGNVADDQDDDTEEIIPPPSQFCNPDKSFENILNSVDDSFCQGDNEDLKFGDSSIFEDASNDVLTPTNEIETWTLSPEEPSYSPPPVSQTHTVIHRLMPNFNLNPQYRHASHISRREKLHQFKFNGKKKYKN